MSEEVDLIVESLLSVLLRTILEISNRPQTPASTMRPQSQDVTVREQKIKRETWSESNTALNRAGKKE